MIHAWGMGGAQQRERPVRSGAEPSPFLFEKRDDRATRQQVAAGSATGIVDLPKLDLHAIAARGYSSSRASSALAKESSDHGASMVIRVMTPQAAPAPAPAPAPEASVQTSLAQALNVAPDEVHLRVIDLFREWDKDGSGTVDKKEFRKALKMLGVTGASSEMDALFESFDTDGGGKLEFSELDKALKRGGTLQRDYKQQLGGAAATEPKAKAAYVPSYVSKRKAKQPSAEEKANAAADRQVKEFMAQAESADGDAAAAPPAPAEQEVTVAPVTAAAPASSAPAASPLKTPTGRASANGALKEQPARRFGVASSRPPGDRYYQNKNIMTPRTAADSLVNRAAVKGDLAQKRHATQHSRAAHAKADAVRRAKQRRRDAIVRIQSRYRARQAVRQVRERRRRFTAAAVVQRCAKRWIWKHSEAAAAAQAHLEDLRRRKLRLVEEDEAEMRYNSLEEQYRRRAEQAEKEQAEKEAQEAQPQASSAASTKAKGAKSKAAKPEEGGEKKKAPAPAQRVRAGSMAGLAARQARIEQAREAKRLQELKDKYNSAEAEEARKVEEQKRKEEHERAMAQQAKRDEVFASVRAFAEGLADVALVHGDHNEVCRAGAIPCLVAMLRSGVALDVEAATATALTRISQASEVNRIAIRKAGGIPSIVKLAAHSKEEGGVKRQNHHVSAMTSMSMGANSANQDAIREAGGLAVLVRLLSNGPDSIVACDAAEALRHLTGNNPTNGSALREAGGIDWLVALLHAGADHAAAAHAAATLGNICQENAANQAAVLEANGVPPLVAMLGGSVESQGVVCAARCLATLSRDSQHFRRVICEQQATVARLVALLASGASFEGARQTSELLRCLVLGREPRVTRSVVAALRRQDVGIGQHSRFRLCDEFPAFSQALEWVVSAHLGSALVEGRGRGHVQMALNDAITLGLPAKLLAPARAKLRSMGGYVHAELSASVGMVAGVRDADCKPTGAVAALVDAQQRLRDLELARFARAAPHE